MVNATWKIVVAAQCKINPLWFTATDGYMAKARQGTQGKESQLLSWAEFTSGQKISVTACKMSKKKNHFKSRYWQKKVENFETTCDPKFLLCIVCKAKLSEGSKKSLLLKYLKTNKHLKSITSDGMTKNVEYLWIW